MVEVVLPFTVNPVKVPTEVILLCTAEAIVPVKLAAGKEVKLPPEPLKVVADAVPFTVNEVRLPTDVINGCEEVFIMPKMLEEYKLDVTFTEPYTSRA